MIATSELSLPGISGDLGLGLVYNSLMLGQGAPVASGAAGRSWQASLGEDTKVIANDNGSVLLLAPQGRQGLFTPTSPGASTYVSPASFTMTMVKTGATGWTVTDHQSNTVLTFTAAGRLSTVTDRNGQVSTFTYAGSPAHLASIVGTRGSASVRTATFTFTGGWLSKVSQTGDDATVRSATYAYHPAPATDRLKSITDMAGRVTTFAYNSDATVASVTVPGGQVASFLYDQTRRVTQITRTISGAVSAVTRLTYPSATQTLLAGANTSTGTPVATGPHTTYTVNASGRVTAVVDPLGRSRSTSYTPNFDVASATSGGGGTTTLTYGANAGESLTGVASPAGAAASASYNNTGASKYLPSGGSDTQGNAALFTYDGAGNPLTAGNSGTGTTASVTYHPDGTLGTSTDPGGAVTTYGENTAQGQVTSITPPAGSGLGVQNLGYDAYGRLKTAGNGAGVTTTYAYDKLDRVTSVSYSDGTPSVVYDYYPSGAVHTRDTGTTTVTYGYDLLDRLTSRSASTGGGTIAYTYDNAGNLTGTTDSTGSITYTYDNADQLVSQTVTGGDTVGYAYNGDGKRTDTWYATNTARTTFAAHTHTDFDLAGRVGRTWTARASNDTTRVFDTSYCHSPYTGAPCPTNSTSTDTALIAWSTDNLTAARSVYGYDQANRLTSVSNYGGHTYAYTYDSRGNRTTVTTDGNLTQTRTFNTGNQITTTGYAYDTAGQRTSDPVAGTLTYNGAGQMTGKAGGTAGTTATYTYSGTGQNELTHRTTSGSTFDYHYGRTDTNGNPVLETMIKDGTTYALDYDNTGTPVSLRNTAGTRNFLILDGQGSIVGLVTNSGTVSGTYTYDPYGTQLSATGTADAVGINIYRHTMGFTDADHATDWTKHGTRWNDTTTGTWTTQDPLTRLLDPDNANRYNYAGSNPVNFQDPTGNCASKGSQLFGQGFITLSGLGLGTIAAAAGVTLAGGLAIGAVFAISEIVISVGSSYKC